MGVMSVAYTTINGQIVSEKRNGVPSDYIPDALGSTIALLSDTHQITDTWTYWPNGQVRTRTGTNPTPHTFCGTVGYHSDIVNNLTYVQARILRPELARWQTIDPLWPAQLPYAYSHCGPTNDADPTGFAVAIEKDCFQQCWPSLRRCLTDCAANWSPSPPANGEAPNTLAGVCWYFVGQVLLCQLECLGEFGACVGSCFAKNSRKQKHTVCVNSCMTNGYCRGMNPLDMALCCDRWCADRGD
jgi:RHS repeat-associated protein